MDICTFKEMSVTHRNCFVHCRKVAKIIIRFGLIFSGFHKYGMYIPIQINFTCDPIFYKIIRVCLSMHIFKIIINHPKNNNVHRKRK